MRRSFQIIDGLKVDEKKNFDRLRTCFKVNQKIVTAQKLKFYIQDFFSKCDQIAGSCRFGHMYCKNS